MVCQGRRFKSFRSDQKIPNKTNRNGLVLCACDLAMAK